MSEDGEPGICVAQTAVARMKMRRHRDVRCVCRPERWSSAGVVWDARCSGCTGRSTGGSRTPVGPEGGTAPTVRRTRVSAVRVDTWVPSRVSLTPVLRRVTMDVVRVRDFGYIEQSGRTGEQERASVKTTLVVFFCVGNLLL